MSIKPKIETCKKCPQYSVRVNPLNDFDDIFGSGGNTNNTFQGDLYKHVMIPYPDPSQNEIVCGKMNGGLFGFGIYYNDELISIDPDALVPNDCDFLLEYTLKKDADDDKPTSL